MSDCTLMRVNKKQAVQPTFRVADLGASLFGRGRGERDLVDWQRSVPQSSTLATPWLVDFAGVTVTYSYIDATLGEILSQISAGKYPEVYPAVINASADTLEELLACLELREAAIWILKEQSWRVAGPLDVSLQEALLQIATDEGHGSKVLSAGSSITQAGWSNRLTALVRHRLITRTRTGKSFNYRATPRIVTPVYALEVSPAMFLRSSHGLSRPR